MIGIDIFYSVLLVGFLARGIWLGFVKQLAFIVALVASYWIAGSYYQDFQPYISPLIKSPQISFVVTYLLLMIVVYISVMLLGVGLKKVMSVTFLSWFDRLLGGAFGLGKAVFVASLVFLCLSAFLANSKAILEKSIYYPLLAPSSEFLLQVFRDEDMRTAFLPREPAISKVTRELTAVMPSLPGGQSVGGDTEIKSGNQ